MKQWYKSAPVKGGLLILQQVLVVLAVVCIAWLFSYPGLSQDIMEGNRQKYYQDSRGFGQQVFADGARILDSVAAKDQLETEGQLDGQRIIDIQEFNKTGKITGENVNGLAYRMDDLKNWNEEISNGDGKAETGSGSMTGQDAIIVCQKMDGSYYYYYYRDFRKLLDSGELSFVTDPNAAVSETELAEMLKDGMLYEDSYESDMQSGTIVDKNNQIVYQKVWNYDGYWVTGDYKPVDAESLLEIVNNDPKWNGRLEEAFHALTMAMESLNTSLESYKDGMDTWQEGDTNLVYLYADLKHNKLYTNKREYEDISKLEENLDLLTQMGRYVIVRPQLADFSTNIKGAGGKEWRHMASVTGTTQEDFVYAIGVDTSYPIQDDYYTENLQYEKYAPQVQKMVVLGMVSVVLIFGIIIWMTIVAGRKPEDDRVYLNAFDRLKTELAALLVIGAWFGITFLLVGAGGTVSYVVDDAGIGHYYDINPLANPTAVVAMCAIGVSSCTLFMLGYLSLIKRIKARTIWKNSLCKWLLELVGKVGRHIHEVWKQLLMFAGFLCIHWLLATTQAGLFIILALAADVLAALYLVSKVLGRQKIHAGVERIANGEVDYKIPLDGLKGEQLEIAERINTIGEGLDAAVEASMKNERLKTDLITNVSHDIKTPLTSIINYVDLLKRENFADPKIQGYLDILEAKAQRLKTLTEDVVEASKVSSGNITLEYMNINLSEMIQQTSGEFEEKFSKRNLREVLNLPDEDAIIRVDGRRMWRVLENIYNNTAKYAMEGSRVYADLKVFKDTVQFSLKNISEQPLNIDAEELTERFIRGDVSRSTEGSGLGLSIAKSLTEMQGGTFEIYLDGDLFKVTIQFPRMAKAEEEKAE